MSRYGAGQLAVGYLPVGCACGHGGIVVWYLILASLVVYEIWVNLAIVSAWHLLTYLTVPTELYCFTFFLKISLLSVDSNKNVC